MTLYLIRHGQTEGNAGRFVQGNTLVGLTEKGRSQARAIGKVIKESGIVFDRLFCSDLYRTRQTFSIVFPDENDRERVVYDTRLREIDNTVIAGRDLFSLSSDYGEFYRDASRRLDYARFGGESSGSIMERARSFFDYVATECAGCENVAAVTHGGFITAALCNVIGAPRIDIRAVHIKNCSVSEFIYSPENNCWILSKFNNRKEI
ncbi:MAG: histidine phosphatase family protein [Clostridia bacterium]|nr:histidine phosphatase family protein [Clostridia bacterium]